MKGARFARYAARVDIYGYLKVLIVGDVKCRIKSSNMYCRSNLGEDKLEVTSVRSPNVHRSEAYKKAKKSTSSGSRKGSSKAQTLPSVVFLQVVYGLQVDL
uniref:Transposase_23 domain-containing protein n=1 Tax=Steinernema glaseri TaxID=37863 RepID=A0A1I8A343_9BILA